jgi:hypothetical protein
MRHGDRGMGGTAEGHIHDKDHSTLNKTAQGDGWTMLG